MQKDMVNRTEVLGIMSGTSLDGIDMADCILQYHPSSGWDYSIKAAGCYPYDKRWESYLRNAHKLSSDSLISLHFEYAVFLAEQINQFISSRSLHPSLLALHGHTIFHQPARGYTFQLGHPGVLAAHTGIEVAGDFRSVDVALGGQGAPLVPLGDRLLFPVYDACLNLGGFANISFEKDGDRMAFDICPLNMALNYLAKKAECAYDEDGQMARKGQIIPGLLDSLESLSFYKQHGPKSLGREWFETEVKSLFNEKNIPGQLATYIEHICLRIAAEVKNYAIGSMLITGGGTHNTFLIENIRKHCPDLDIHIPEPLIIDFKEALVFALLGLLRKHEMLNVLSSYTGAKRSSCSACLYL